MNVQKVLVIARHEYRVNLRRPGFLIVTGLVPLLGLAVLLLAALASGPTASALERVFVGRQITGVVDRSGLFTPLLPEYTEVYRLYPDEARGRAALATEEVDRLVLVPSDYLDTGRITVVARSTGLIAVELEEATDLERFFVAHLARDLPDPRLRARLVDPFEPILDTLDRESGPQEGGPLSIVGRFVVPYVLSILLIMTIFVSSGYLLRSVAEEKTNRVIEILLSSVTAQELLAGKVLGLGALGLTQIGVWLLSGFGLSSGAFLLLGLVIPLFTQPTVLLLAAVYYVLGFLMYAVLMASVGALGTDVQEAQQLAGLFSLLAAVPLMLASVFFANPDSALIRVVSWFPLTAPTAMMLRLPMAQVPALDIGGSILSILGTIPLILWLGGKLFRLGLLMYGKRPGVREILRLLREA